MNARSLTPLLLIALALSVPAFSQEQPKRPKRPSETVLAVLDGVEYTVRDVKRLRSSLPPNVAPQVSRMTHRNFLKIIHDMMGVAKTAEQEGLLEREPYKTQFNFMRWNALANAYTTDLNRTIVVSEDEIAAYYTENQAIYSAVRVSGIYIDYVPESGGASVETDGLTEQQAREKAERLVSELKGGADFAALAKEHSDDKISAEKGGDLGLFSSDSPLPAAIKNAVVRLPVGGITDPVKDGGRFYVFKATDRRPKSLSEVREQIEPALRSKKILQAAQAAKQAVSLEFTDAPELDQVPEPPPQGVLPGQQ